MDWDFRNCQSTRIKQLFIHLVFEIQFTRIILRLHIIEVLLGLILQISLSLQILSRRNQHYFKNEEFWRTKNCHYYASFKKNFQFS